MRKIKDNILTFLIITIILTTCIFASPLYSSDSIILSNGTSVQSALDTLFANNSDCPSGYKCSLIHNTPQVGDYVKMTPTLRSFTTDKTKTGESSSDIIYPSQLNLWRVIKVNSDGTIEIVADEPSKEEVWFYGRTGYMNYVGYLNVLASKYENSKYTIGSRYMGYSNQTGYITDNSKITQTTAPWACDTGASCHPENQENLGGGDLGYVNDINLVQNVYGTLKSKYSYFLASRYYDYTYSGSFGFLVRRVETNLSTENATYSSDKSNAHFYDQLRPILILKAGINYTPGPGTLDNPFILD